MHQCFTHTHSSASFSEHQYSSHSCSSSSSALFFRPGLAGRWEVRQMHQSCCALTSFLRREKPMAHAVTLRRFPSKPRHPPGQSSDLSGLLRAPSTNRWSTPLHVEHRLYEIQPIFAPPGKDFAKQWSRRRAVGSARQLRHMASKWPEGPRQFLVAVEASGKAHRRRNLTVST